MVLIDDENCTLYNALAESAAKLAYNNFKWQYATFLFFNATFCGVNVFVKTYNKMVITGQIIQYASWFVEGTSQFVLFVKDTEEISIKLESLEKKEFNNAGKYIIVCNSMEKGRCDENEAVMLFWKYRISNVILIKYNNEQKVVGYTYFQNRSCGPGRPRKLKRWESCIEWNSTDNCEKYMFPVKFKNFHRCPLYVSTFVQDPYMFLNDGVPSGADGDLLRVIAATLNASLVIVTPNQGSGWGSLNANGTWTGSFGDIYHDRANFSMTSASITSQRFKYFQLSTNYNTVCVGWVTHPADFEPSSLKLLKPFSLQTRIILTIVLVVMIFLAVCLPICLWKSNRTRYLITSNIVTNMFQVCMGLPLKRFPAKWFFKCLILISIWYCYILRSFYQVNLIIFLQNDVRQDSVFTIKEAIQQGYSFGGGPALKEYYVNEPIVYNNWIDLESNEIPQTMIELSHGKKFVLAMNLATTRRFLFSNPQEKLHVLPQKIMSSPSVIFFKKYSMISQSINQVLTKLFEAGITDHLLENFISNDGERTINIIQPIKLEHLHGSFCLLFVGWALSIIIAIAEKIYNIYAK